jgi:hypothetical protein
LLRSESSTSVERTEAIFVTGIDKTFAEKVRLAVPFITKVPIVYINKPEIIFALP